MTKTWIQPKLVMGHLEVVGPDDEVAIPYDEAVIHLEGDEDSEIEVRCPGALRLAPIIVRAVNNHGELVRALTELHAMVWGECPSLLNEDSGGNSRLDTSIRDILDAVEGVAK